MNYWIVPCNIKKELTVEAIVEIFEQETPFTFIDFLRKNRKEDLSIVRHLLVYMIKKHLNYSLEKIGEALGNRDHTTALNSIKAAMDMLDTNDEFNQLSDKIEKRITTEYKHAVRPLAIRINERLVRRAKRTNKKQLIG